MLTHFRNVDLELTSEFSLEPIVNALGDQVHVLHRDLRGNKHFASFETAVQHEEPESNLMSFCHLLASLSDDALLAWHRCEKRVLDLGFEAAAAPRCFRSTLSSGTLSQIASLEIQLAFSIYPAARAGSGAA